MEHFKSPFSVSDFSSVRALDNQRFFEDVLTRARTHPFFTHPFLSTCEKVVVSRDIAAIVLTSFYKIVAPFTGLLFHLGGRSPDLRTRFALMDNIYEEMGCGDLEAAHPSLYLRMLASIGVTADVAEASPTLSSIRRINEHLEEVVTQQPFAAACAVLASAEATIPPSFPVLATIARTASPDVDTQFFDRHGVRDEGHCDDAATLFALTADSSQFALVERAVKRDLDHRVELFDEWLWTIRPESTRPRSGASHRPQPRSSRHAAEHPSVPA
jgi:pyrroloquinoline quinone (PQQ) biosynthesis protein C